MGEGTTPALRSQMGVRPLVTLRERKINLYIWGKEEWESARVDVEKETGRVAEGGELQHDKAYKFKGRNV